MDVYLRRQPEKTALCQVLQKHLLTFEQQRSDKNGCAATASTPDADNCRTFDGCTSSFVECAYCNLGHSMPSNWARESWAFFATFKSSQETHAAAVTIRDT